MILVAKTYDNVVYESKNYKTALAKYDICETLHMFTLGDKNIVLWPKTANARQLSRILQQFYIVEVTDTFHSLWCVAKTAIAVDVVTSAINQQCSSNLYNSTTVLLLASSKNTLMKFLLEI